MEVTPMFKAHANRDTKTGVCMSDDGNFPDVVTEYVGTIPMQRSPCTGEYVGLYRWDR